MIKNSICFVSNQLIKSFASRQYYPIRALSSAATKLVDVDVNDKTGIAIVTLNRAPVNSLNLELLTDFARTLDDLESNKSKGMILTSASKTVFSAGLDILEMYKPEPDRSRAFWTALQDVWLKLYGSSSIHGLVYGSREVHKTAHNIMFIYRVVYLMVKHTGSNVY